MVKLSRWSTTVFTVLIKYKAIHPSVSFIYFSRLDFLWCSTRVSVRRQAKKMGGGSSWLFIICNVDCLRIIWNSKKRICVYEREWAWAQQCKWWNGWLCPEWTEVCVLTTKLGACRQISFCFFLRTPINSMSATYGTGIIILCSPVIDSEDRCQSPTLFLCVRMRQVA